MHIYQRIKIYFDYAHMRDTYKSNQFNLNHEHLNQNIRNAVLNCLFLSFN